MPALYQVYLDFLSGFGCQGSQAEFDSLNGPSLPEIMQALKNNHHLSQDVITLGNIYQVKAEHAYQTLTLPMTNSEQILSQTPKLGVKQMLVTSTKNSLARTVLQRLNWEKYFDDFVFGNEVQISKPAPEIYQLAVRKAGIATKAALAIEDSINGVKSARSAGIFTLGFTSHKSPQNLIAAGANAVVTDLGQILDFL